MKRRALILAAAFGLIPLSALAEADASELSLQDGLRQERLIQFDAALSAHFSSDVHTGEWVPLIDRVYNISQGYTYTPIYSFARAPIHVDAINGELLALVGERCGATITSIDVMHAPGQSIASRYIPDAAGTIALPNAKIYKIMATIYQASRARSTCAFRLSVKPHDAGQPDNPGSPTNPTNPTNPPPEAYTLAGVIRYDGGFHYRVGVDIPGEKIQRFWVRVPSYCQELELLEAGTISEGYYDAASMIDQSQPIFEINQGAGARVSAVYLSLNGPYDLTCDIPVYVFKSGGE